jgi:hypothetical protein
MKGMKGIQEGIQEKRRLGNATNMFGTAYSESMCHLDGLHTINASFLAGPA